MITTITGKNQITIPAKLVNELNLHPGIRIDWSVSEDGLLIARPLPPRGELARQTAGMGRKWLRKDDDPIADLIDERAHADKDEGLS